MMRGILKWFCHTLMTHPHESELTLVFYKWTCSLSKYYSGCGDPLIDTRYIHTYLPLLFIAFSKWNVMRIEFFQDASNFTFFIFQIFKSIFLAICIYVSWWSMKTLKKTFKARSFFVIIFIPKYKYIHKSML